MWQPGIRGPSVRTLNAVHDCDIDRHLSSASQGAPCMQANADVSNCPPLPCRDSPTGVPLNPRRSSDAAPPRSLHFDWRIEPSRLKVHTRPDGSDWKLGAGGYASVYLAILDDVEEVAVKVMATDAGREPTQEQLQQFEVEVNIMRAARHRNIARFIGAQISKVHRLSLLLSAARLYACPDTCLLLQNAAEALRRLQHPEYPAGSGLCRQIFGSWVKTYDFKSFVLTTFSVWVKREHNPS